MERSATDKRDFLLYLLEKGDALVCLDARKPGVKVPANHKGDPTLRLVLNLNFRRPMEITQEGIYATLAFQGRPSRCVVPFESVWAIFEPSLKEGQVWEESVPKDMAPALEPAAPGSQKTSEPRGNPFARKVPGGSSRAKRDRSHLRVIK
ncbi:MAG: ClpXP protease specificity-enhancing factor SspB [Nitrospinales bacterium]